MKRATKTIRLKQFGESKWDTYRTIVTNNTIESYRNELALCSGMVHKLLGNTPKKIEVTVCNVATKGFKKFFIHPNIDNFNAESWAFSNGQHPSDHGMRGMYSPAKKFLLNFFMENGIEIEKRMPIYVKIKRAV